MTTNCRICGDGQAHSRLRLREMQLGMRDEFEYFQCGNCGCIQIEQTPGDLARYYPANYYSLAMNLEKPSLLVARIFFRGVKIMAPLVRMLLTHQGWLGRWPRWLLSRLDLRLSILDVMSQTGIQRNSAILDVGCGQGFIPFCLAQIGFRRVTGIDPFIAGDLHYRNGLAIRKVDIFAWERTAPEKYDLIVFHHSLEHMENQAGVLRSAAGLLRDGGRILVRMPVVDCEGFEIYRENFVSLDAPRHLLIHTRKSAALMAEQAGLVLEKVVYESNESQFWASEQYKRDIPLESPQSYRHNKHGSIFTRRQIREFRARARQLNATGRGDWAAFFLCKAPPLPVDEAALLRHDDPRSKAASSTKAASFPARGKPV